jgi:hypothetical protein
MQGNSNQKNQDITCFNCDCKGHYKADCWRPGGGKEGQGPNQKGSKGNHPSKQAANVAMEADNTENYAFAAMSNLASVAEKLNVPLEHHGAIIDSGTTSHFCPDRSKFENFITIPPQDIYTADGSKVSAIRRGDVKIDLLLKDKCNTVTLWNTLCAPQISFTLISTTRIAASGLAVLFEGQMCKILSVGPKHTIIAEIHQVGGLYSIVLAETHCKGKTHHLQGPLHTRPHLPDCCKAHGWERVGQRPRDRFLVLARVLWCLHKGKSNMSTFSQWDKELGSNVCRVGPYGPMGSSADNESRRMHILYLLHRWFFLSDNGRIPKGKEQGTHGVQAIQSELSLTESKHSYLQVVLRPGRWIPKCWVQ